jgi:hypothetical protein
MFGNLERIREWAVVCVVAAPFLWLLVLFLLARASGWAKLQRLYQSGLPPRTNPKVTKVRFGRVTYSDVSMGFSEYGIHLQMRVLFKLFHPPLLLPWQAIRNHKQKPIYFTTWDTFDVESEIEPGKFIQARVAELIPREYVKVIKSQVRRTA